MWLLATLAATAALLARRLGLRDPAGSATPQTARVIAPVLLTAAIAVALAQTIVVGVLASFARDLDVDAVGAAWLLTAFMLASAVATPIAGRLGDQYGHHRLIVTGLVLLVIGSGLAAVSTAEGWYAGTLSGRVLQGLAGGVFPCTFGLARQLLPARKLPGTIAALSAMFGVGGAAGMVVAGPWSTSPDSPRCSGWWPHWHCRPSWAPSSYQPARRRAHPRPPLPVSMSAVAPY